MYELILSVIRYKENRGDNDFAIIAKQFERVIKKGLQSISKIDREDVYQIVLMKLEELILCFRVIMINKLNKKNRKYFIRFLENDKRIKGVNKDLDNYFNCYKYDFKLYSNQNIFIKYIYIRLPGIIKNSCAKLRRISSNEILTLNEVNNGIEFINEIKDVSWDIKYEILMSAISLLDRKDKEFIIWYFYSRQAINEEQAALILKVTQQAVSKRLNRIYRKLREIYIELVINN